MEEINQNQQTAPQVYQTPQVPQTPGQQPPKKWLKIVAIGVGVLVLLSSILGVVWWGRNNLGWFQTKPYEIGYAVKVGKLYLTINHARRLAYSFNFNFAPPDKQLLLLEATFENRDSVIGRNSKETDLYFSLQNFSLTDENGRIQNLVTPSNTVRTELFTTGIFNFIDRSKLEIGQSTTGYLVFAIDKNNSKFNLSYPPVNFLINPDKIKVESPQQLPSFMQGSFFTSKDIPVEASRFVELAKEDLVKRFSVNKDNVGLMIGTVNQWSGSSLGCTSSSNDNSEIIPGYDLLLTDGNLKFYTYHTNKDSQKPLVVFCRAETSPLNVQPPPASGSGILSGSLEMNGTIRLSNTERSCWYIESEQYKCEGSNCPLSLPIDFTPINLSENLKQVGLKAKFKLEIQLGMATTCQMGPVVKILDYQIIK